MFAKIIRVKVLEKKRMLRIESAEYDHLRFSHLRSECHRVLPAIFFDKQRVLINYSDCQGVLPKIIIEPGQSPDHRLRSAKQTFCSYRNVPHIPPFLKP
jgi:hypothetical protein